MTPAQFCEWLQAMKDQGLSKSDAHSSRLLGITPASVVNMKRDGTDRRTALACRALLHRLPPYGEPL